MEKATSHTFDEGLAGTVPSLCSFDETSTLVMVNYVPDAHLQTWLPSFKLTGLLQEERVAFALVNKFPGTKACPGDLLVHAVGSFLSCLHNRNELSSLSHDHPGM